MASVTQSTDLLGLGYNIWAWASVTRYTWTMASRIGLLGPGMLG